MNHSRLVLPFLIFVLFILMYGHSFPGETKKNNNLDFSKYEIIFKRNVFRPLWHVSSEKVDDKSRKEEIEALKKAEEEQRAADRAAEEKATIDNKKNEITQNYSLTGIINEKGKDQAIIQKNEGTSYFVFQDETFDGLKVISINGSKGEIIVDWQGKLTVSLALK